MGSQRSGFDCWPAGVQLIERFVNAVAEFGNGRVNKFNVGSVRVEDAAGGEVGLAVVVVWKPVSVDERSVRGGETSPG